jgi:hypothetical protein
MSVPRNRSWADFDRGRSPHLARCPDHEQPSKLPDVLKRLDLEAVVDGNKIASEAQRLLYDDVKRGSCTRCHKDDHIGKDCKEPKANWEDKFDKEKSQHWTSVLKWQQRALEQKGANPKDPPKHPTLHIKPEQRSHTLMYDSDSDDNFSPLQHFRMTLQDPDDAEDDAPPLNVAADQVEINRSRARRKRL